MLPRPTVRHLIAALALACSCAAVLPGAAYSGADDAPFTLDRRIIHGDGSPGPYVFGAPFIGGTARVTDAGDSLWVATDDPVAGTVTFSAPVADGDSVLVEAALPPPAFSRPFTRPLEPSRTMRMPTPGAAQEEGTKLGPLPGLTFGGSKTFEISTGSEYTAAVNQTLRLNVSGRITDDITVTAILSDQNIPITPEGTTRELDELNRVYIDVRGPRFQVEMGDTELTSDTGHWLVWSRRLSGAQARVNLGTVEASASAAVSEGRYASTVVTPVEGTQGPYRLTGADGRSDITLIPGTERVWINGEHLERGLNDDYIIDYDTGELTFTERRIIGSDMRIVCDYQYTSDSYRRHVYSAGTSGAFFGGRLTLAAAAAREADDPDKPVLTAIDDEVRDLLAASGDTPALAAGIRPATDDTTGTYDIKDGHLVHNPRSKGAYNAAFSWVGRDAGSYRYTGGGIYAFVPPAERGDGSGASYDPVTLVPGPVSHDIAGAVVTFTPMTGVTFDGELAGTSVDANTLSSRDDADNAGRAYRAGFALTPAALPDTPVALSLSANRRTQDARFSPLDRDRTAEENRLWGLPLVSAGGAETVTDASAGAAVRGGMFGGSGIDTTLGRMELDGEARSTRSAARGILRGGGRGTGSIDVSRIIREGAPGLPDESIARLDGSLETRFAGFTPHASWESERAKGINGFDHGAAYGEIRTSIDTPVVGGVTGTTAWFYRRERALGSAWRDSSYARGGSVEARAALHGGTSLTVRYARRERVTGGLSGTSDQALVEYSRTGTGGAPSIDLSYRAGREREAMTRRTYLYVGGGRGSYRWEDADSDGVRDPDEFVPDEFGAYYPYEETLETYTPVNAVRTYARVAGLVPSVLTRWTGLDLAGARSETSVEITETSTAPASDIFLMKLGRFRKAGATVSGESRVQEDLTVPVAREGSLRLRLFRRDALNTEFAAGAERRGDQEQSLRLRIPASSRVDVEGTLARTLAARTMQNAHAGDYRVQTLSADGAVSYHPGARLTFTAGGGGGYDRDSVSDVRARYLIARPVVTYRFSGRGRIEGAYTLTAVRADIPGDGTRFAWTMARGRKPGDNHDISLTCDYRLTDRMNLVASYSGRRFPGRSFEHFARVQFRAMF